MSIQCLTYRVEKPHEFIDENVIKFAHALANFNLANGILLVDLHSPVDSISEAREYIDPVVRAWEFEAEIRRDFPVIKFEFVADAVVGANPELSSATSGDDDEDVKLIIRSRYPSAPTIAVTSQMENIWERYLRARGGIGESIESATYYGLTVIETQFGSRKEAAVALKIDYQILSKLGELSSTRGDITTARKAGASIKPLSQSEKIWIDHCMRCLLIQMGCLAADVIPQEIQPVAFPTLT